MSHATRYGHAGDRPMPGIFFWSMAAMFKLRDWFKPRGVLLDEVPLRLGDTVLDYGCGPGSYIPELAKRVGPDGAVIALDIHPLAVQRVERMAAREGWNQVRTYLTDGLRMDKVDTDRVDAVLLFDVFHMLGDQEQILAEIRRVLRPGGVLAVNDPHMDPAALIAGVTRFGSFALAKRGNEVATFGVSGTAGVGAAR